MSVAASGSAPVLAWPLDASYFSLYAATNLAPPVVWSRATNASVLSNHTWSVTISSGTNAARFFRLQSQ